MLNITHAQKENLTRKKSEFRYKSNYIKMLILFSDFFYFNMLNIIHINALRSKFYSLKSGFRNGKYLH